jgi:hypothetical protein
MVRPVKARVTGGVDVMICRGVVSTAIAPIQAAMLEVVSWSLRVKALTKGRTASRAATLGPLDP